MTNIARIVALVLLLTAMATGSVWASDWKSVDVDHFHLEWMVDGDVLKLKISAPVTGWVAVGFNPTNKMKDADIIIGYVDDGELFIEDHYGNTAISHRPDERGNGTNDIFSASGRESGGTTELSFSIPLDSGDSRDQPLVEGQEVKVIFASHTADRITAKHNRRTSTVITL